MPQSTLTHLFLSSGSFPPQVRGLQHPHSYIEPLQIHPRSSGTHNSPLKCSQLSLRQKRSFNHTGKLCTCFVCSHVLMSFHLSLACSWSFKIHDFTFMVSSGCLSPTLYGPIRIQRFLSPLIYGWEIYRPFFTLIKGKLGAGWGSFSRSGDLSWSNLPRSIFLVTHRCVDSLVSIFT